MDIKIIISKQDPVGRTIKELGYSFEEVDEDVIDFKYNKGDAIIIFSRHESASKVPTFTVHIPGNPTNKIMGGEPHKLGIAFPRLLTSIYREIKNITLDISKSLEATHHGPTYQTVPVIFVEIGSTIEYWTNKKLVKYLVEATLRSINEIDKIVCENVITGFGGPHYAPLFSKLATNNECIAHILSKYVLVDITDDVIRQSVLNSVEKVNKIVFDSVNKDTKIKILDTLRDFNITVQSV